MWFKILSISILGIFISLSMAVGDDDGPANMDLFGGKRGKVPFPHNEHQQRLKDCNACHSLFPKKSNAINDYIKKGALKNKQVMNKLCVKCHKAEKKAGKPSGPTTCSKCHVK